MCNCNKKTHKLSCECQVCNRGRNIGGWAQIFAVVLGISIVIVTRSMQRLLVAVIVAFICTAIAAANNPDSY